MCAAADGALFSWRFFVFFLLFLLLILVITATRLPATDGGKIPELKRLVDFGRGRGFAGWGNNLSLSLELFLVDA